MQKYAVGANWYPTFWLNFAGQYYHKNSEYDNDFRSDLATPPVTGAERNQRLLHQELDSDDFNVRMTLRPRMPAKMGTLALVFRYDYVHATIDGQWAISPATPPPFNPPTGTIYDSQQSAEITNHVITGTATWNPCARFYLQGNFSYVLNETDTPASDINLIPNRTATVLDSQSDYWMAGGDAGFIIDDKTDLHAQYTYYRADNYVNNASAAMPYGMSDREYTASATFTRQLTKSLRLKLQYSYFHYIDVTSGLHNNYEAHAFFSSLQFRF
jgi:predicted porin